jgi:hypothetical protein
VNGFQVNVEQRGGPPFGVVDTSVKLRLLLPGGGGEVLGPDDAAKGQSLTASDAVTTYPGFLSNFGVAWSPAQINDPGFGVLYRVTGLASLSQAELDQLTLTADWTYPVSDRPASTATPSVTLTATPTARLTSTPTATRTLIPGCVPTFLKRC